MRTATNAVSLAALVTALFAAPLAANAVVFHIQSTAPARTSSAPAATTTSTPMNMTTASSGSQPTTTRGSGSTGTTGTATPPNNNTGNSVDLRFQQTLQATQSQRASAGTAASQFAQANEQGPLTSAPGTTTTSTGVSGSTTGTGTTTGTTTGNEGNVTTAVGTGGFIGAVGTIVNPGEPVFDANGNVVGASTGFTTNTTTTTAYAPALQSNGIANADIVVADNTMNQVIGTAKRDRHRIGRNGQLLYSIAPRTNVDRSAEVPDDGPTPALTGPVAR